MALLRVGFLTAVAGLSTTIYIMIPFAVLVTLPEIRASRIGAHPTSYSAEFMRSWLWLDLAWIALAGGLGVALAAYVAPEGQSRTYARASLLVTTGFYVLLLVEALVWPHFAPAASPHTTIRSKMLSASGLASAFVGYLLTAFVGWRIGLAARNRPGATMTRLLEWCRRMPVGHVFGKPIRLRL